MLKTKKAKQKLNKNKKSATIKTIIRLDQSWSNIHLKGVVLRNCFYTGKKRSYTCKQTCV